MYSNSSHSQ